MTRTYNLMRKYSLGELDRMRQCILWMTMDEQLCWHERELDSKVEEKLRTCMMAGVEPEEIEKQANDISLARMKQQSKMEQRDDPPRDPPKPVVVEEQRAVGRLQSAINWWKGKP